MQKVHSPIIDAPLAPLPVSSSSQNLLNSHDRLKTKRTTEKHQDLEALAKETVQLCHQYIKENNHIGLALIARQRGIPPALRFRVWPILLKYHPYVIAPYINATVESESDTEIDEKRVHNDITKYFKIRTPQTVKESGSSHNSLSNSPSGKEIVASPIEEEIIRILQASISKFFRKWGGIVKYDSGFAWMALNLAEWFPPIPNSNYVLIGRSHVNKFDKTNRHLTQLTEEETSAFTLDDTATTGSDSSSSSSLLNKNMTFSEVYERLVLVLLHSKESPVEKETEVESRRNSVKDQNNLLTPSRKLNIGEILFKSGKPEHHITIFLSALSKVLPELYKSLSEEEILNNNKNNQWLTWWLKYCGAKLLNKFDRGRLWDLILGFRLSYEDFTKEYESSPKALKAFKKFYTIEDDDKTFEKFDSDPFWFKPSESPTVLKWSQCDYQYQLIFIFISILHKNEASLLEFDQSEIIEFLNKLNYKRNSEDLIKFDWLENNFMQKAIIDAGEIWRTWLWNEIRDEINE